MSQPYVYRRADDKTWNVIDTRTNEIKKNCKTPMEALLHELGVGIHASHDHDAEGARP